MKKIGEILPIAIETAREEKEERVMLDPLSAELVVQLFAKMALICRGFDSFYSDKNRLNAEKTQWIMVFSRLGIRNKSQIINALHRLETYTFPNPPQLGEFLQWNKGDNATYGLPNFEEAYKLSIIINQQFSAYTPRCDKTYTVIRHAIGQIGSMEYRSMTREQSRKVFEKTYLEACSQFNNGKLETITKSIAEKPEIHPSDKIRTDEARKIALEKIKGILK